MAWTKRFVRADAAGGGDGTTNTNSGANGAWTLAEGITNEAAGMKLMVIGSSGTFANTSTDRTLAASGTATAPIWWQGCNAAEDDLLADFVTAKPSITFTTGRFLVTGSFHLLTALNISGAMVTASSGQLAVNTAVKCWFDRLRVQNTAANANARAVWISANAHTFTRCWFKSTSSAPIVDAQSVAGGGFIGCSFDAGSNGLINPMLNGPVAFCTFSGQTGDCIRYTAAGIPPMVLNCTFYNPTSDGIEITLAPTNCGVIIGCIFSNCAGAGINNSLGTNIANVVRAHNDFFSCGSNEIGFGDWPSLTQLADSSSPFTNAAGGDLSMVSGSAGKGASIPGLFENEIYSSFLDCGAVQRQEAVPGPFMRQPVIWFDPESMG